MSIIVQLLAGLLFLKAAVRWVTLLKTEVSGVGKDAEIFLHASRVED